MTTKTLCSKAIIVTFSTLWLSACADPGIDRNAATVVKEGALDGSAEVETLPVTAKTLIKDLEDPWGIDFLPDGNLLITEKTGSLLLVDAQDFSSVEISGLPAVADAGQGGLLDVLVHPEFESNNYIYFSYAIELDKLYTTRVARAKLRDGQLLGTEVLFTAEPAFKQRRHFGSRLLIKDSLLYFSVGDRGNRALAQSLETHNGKIMRLHDNGAVPHDNPFVDSPPARPEIYSYGHRNPQGMAMHPYNDSLWVAEHGPQGGDEINIVQAGKNYGWPLITYGEEYGGGAIGQGTHSDGLQQPLVYWVPSIGTGGIDFYTGDLYPGWKDSLLVSGLRSTRISRLELEGDGLGRESRLLADLDMRVRDLQLGPDGLLYALVDGSRLMRLELTP